MPREDSESLAETNGRGKTSQADDLLEKLCVFEACSNCFCGGSAFKKNLVEQRRAKGPRVPGMPMTW